MRRRGTVLLLLGMIASTLAGCAWAAGTPTPSPASPTITPTLTATHTQPPTYTATPTPRVFPPPRETALTPIPTAAELLELPDEVRVVLLVGQDKPDPFTGRTDAILLLLYHPRLAKAALISVPPDMYGYLPGWTMQRFSSAYSLGGPDLLVDTLDYNLGIRPGRYLVANLDDFAILVDEMGGLDVPVLEAFPGACGEIIYPGHVFMNGEQALCYATLREGMKEAPRGLRQQLLLRLLLERFLSEGNLSRLSELFSLFRPRLDTNLTALDVAEAIPLALRFGDAERTAYFQIGADQTRVWQISTRPPAQVFLPRPDRIRQILEQAVAFISEPSPMSDLVLTLEYELTQAGTPGATRTETPTPSPTIEIFSTETLTPTITVTLEISPSITPTPTATLTPTGTPPP